MADLCVLLEPRCPTLSMRPIVTKPELPSLPDHSWQLITELAEEPKMRARATYRSKSRVTHRGRASLAVVNPLLDWLGPVLADVFEVPSHKTFGGALVMAHDRGEQWPVLIG